MFYKFNRYLAFTKSLITMSLSLFTKEIFLNLSLITHFIVYNITCATYKLFYYFHSYQIVTAFRSMQSQWANLISPLPMPSNMPSSHEFRPPEFREITEPHFYTESFLDMKTNHRYNHSQDLRCRTSQFRHSVCLSLNNINYHIIHVLDHRRRNSVHLILSISLHFFLFTRTQFIWTRGRDFLQN